jgi:hypothetical protein
MQCKPHMHGGWPIQSMAPRKAPRKIAPARLAVEVRVEVAQVKEVQHTKKRRASLAAVVQHLETMAKEQRHWRWTP